MDGNVWEMLFGKLNEIEKENALPYEIYNCETDLLIDHMPKFVNLDNYLNYPLMRVECSKNIFQQYEIVVLDAWNSFRKGDTVFSLLYEKIHTGKVTDTRVYSKENCPFTPRQIMYSLEGKTVQKITKTVGYGFGATEKTVYQNPFTFNFSGYGTIAQGAFSLFDPEIHNNEYVPTVKKSSIFQKSNKLVIPENIYILGKESFRYRDDIDEVSILNEKTIMLDGVFADCPNIKALSIPRKTVIIHPYSFFQCFSLKEMFFPEALMAICEDAFAKCKSLSRISFMPNSKLQIIGNGAFSDCDLEVVDLSNCTNLKEIKTFAFRNNKHLREVILPRNVKLHRFAFAGCPNVTLTGWTWSQLEPGWDVVEDEPVTKRLKRGDK